MKRHVIFVQNVMAGGGAERHTINIINHLISKGWSAQILLTAMKTSEIVTLFNLDPSVKVESLLDKERSCGKLGEAIHRVESFILKCITWFLCHTGRGHSKPKWLMNANFISENRDIINGIREVIRKADKTAVLLSVLDVPTFQTFFANKKYGKNHVVAEFADPVRKMAASPFVTMMFHEYYQKADRLIFQTPGAMSAFNAQVQKKGVVIPNPLSGKLPKPYTGTRTKEIVNFCRFSAQKNIPLLLKAFKLLHDEYPEYKLTVYGGAVTDEEETCMQECKQLVVELGLESSVSFPGFCSNVHEKIVDAAMFVSSSDFEGLSNSMIEAMAIGLPVVCTDCPAGGASYMIEDGVNGFLTPVGDTESLYKAMKRVVEDKELAIRMSGNAVQVRERLKLEKIADEWMKALDV